MRRRAAFSLIELLIVMGVILVLITIGVIGYNVIEKNVADRATRQTLQTLKAMLAEFEAQTGPGALPAYIDVNGNQIVTINATGGGNTFAMGDVNTGTNNDRYNSNSTQINDKWFGTQIVMGALMRSPKNKAIVSQLNPKLILRNADGSSAPTSRTVTLNGQPATFELGPVLLDGWGNPILYVPDASANTNGSGFQTQLNVSVATGNSVQSAPINSPDHRGFFASAGQDGNFGASNPPPSQPPAFGDDNLYSFQN